MKTLAWVVPALLLPAVLVASPAAADVWTKTYAFTDRPKVRILTDDGSVTVESWDRKDVEVRITTRGWQIPRGVRITDHQTGNDVEVEARTPRRYFSIQWTIHSIAIVVSVPREVDLNIESGDGGIAVRSVSGRVRIHTGDGRITASDVRGELSMSTGDGGIEGSDLDGALHANTGDGRVRVAGRFDALDLESGDGSMVVEAESGSRLGEGWMLHTGDGPMTLRIPGDLRADLDAHTGDGRISVDLPVSISGTMGRRTVRGTLNGGGPPLKLRTGDGSIRIERL